MKKVFESSHFSQYRDFTLAHSELLSEEFRVSYSQKTKVFVSHKHGELLSLMDFIGFLSKEYDIEPYIDSQDPSMPKTTNAETAKRIKEKIDKCDKFILLATEQAIESKWCNWELGYGDAKKYNQNNIAILPMNNGGSTYNGNEYLEIYPHIVECVLGDKYSNGTLITPGYYVRTFNGQSYKLTPLKNWLRR